MAEAGSIFVRIGAHMDDLDAALRHLGRQMKGLEGKFSGLQKQGSRLGDVLKGALSVALGFGAFEALRRGIGSVVGEAISFNSMMEQAQIGFTTMLGSAEKAQAFLDEMADFAARTPFEYPDLLEASRRMLAMGFAAQEILPTIKAVGDAAAGLGLGREGINRITLALGQMRAKAKVTGEEMRQLTEAGVPAWEILAEAMGKSTAEVMKLSEKGLIPAGQAIQWLVEGMEKRFPNMMQRMENTWEGVTSTIRDVWRMTIGALTANLFKGVTQWLQKVRDWATEFYKTFRQFGLQAALAKSFGVEFASAVNAAIVALRGLWNTARAVLGAIARYWAVIKSLALTALAVFLSFKVASWVIGLATKAVAQFALVTAAMRGEAVVASGVLGLVSKVVGIYRLQLHLASMAGIAHVGVLQTLRTALYSVWAALGPLGVAILAVSAALTVGVALWSKYAASVEQANLQRALQAINDQGKKLAESTQSAADGLKGQADATKEAGKAAKDNIQSFDEVHQLMEDTADAAGDVTSGLDEVTIPGLEAPGAVPGLELDTSALEQAKPTLSGFWEWIKQGFANAWNSIKEAVKNVWDWIVNATKPVWEPVAEFFSSLWSGVKDTAMTVWQVIGGLLSSAWQTIASVGITLWQTFTSTLSQLWNDLSMLAGTVWTAVEDLFADTWNNILSTALAIWNALVTVAQTIWSVLEPYFSMLWEGIKTVTLTVWTVISTVLTTIWNTLTTVARTVWAALGSFFTALWEGIKTVAAVAWGLIQFLLATVWFTIVKIAQTVWGVLGPFFIALWEGVKTVALAVWNVLSTTLPVVWNTLVTVAKAVWSVLGPFFEFLWDTVKTIFLTVWKVIETVVVSLWNGLVAAAKVIWAVLEPFFTALWRAVETIFKTIWGPLSQWLSTLWNGIKTAAQAVWSLIQKVIEDPIQAAKTTVDTVWNSVARFLSDIWNTIKASATQLWEAIKIAILTPVNAVGDAVVNAWTWVKDRAVDIWGTLVKAAKEKWEAVKDTIRGAVNGIIEMVNKFIQAFNRIEIRVPSINIPFVGKVGGWTVRVPQIPEIPKLAAGGEVTGPTLAMLGERSTETVIPLSADDFADSLAKAVYQAVVDGFRITSVGQSQQTEREVVLRIDSTNFARLILPAIIREGQRQGLQLVVRPQGV